MIKALARFAALVACVAAAATACAQAPHTHQHGFGNAERWSAYFDDPKRDEWQKPHQVIQALALRPDAVVADLGAGTGYFSVRLARMLPGGKVFAVDAEPDMVRHLEDRAKREGLGNVVPVQAQAGDARLPQKVDLVLLVDVYHHLERRPEYFRRLAASLAPDARIAIIDFRMDSPLGPPREHRIPDERIESEMKSAGYELVRQHDFLPRQHFLIFKRRG